MNSIVVYLENAIPQTALSKDVTVTVDEVEYKGKILLIMTHETLPEETTVLLRGSGLKAVSP